MKKASRKNTASSKKYIEHIIREELINELMSLKTAQQLAKEPIHKASDVPLPKFTGDKDVSNFEKKVQPELMRSVNMLKAYLKFIKPNSADYRTAEEIINNALLTGKIPTMNQQNLITYLASKHGLKEQGAGSGMELTTAANNPTNFGINLKETEIKKPGEKVIVPNKGKMVPGKIVRYDKGQSVGGSPFYVVDIGEYESIVVPAHEIDMKNSISPSELQEMISELVEEEFARKAINKIIYEEMQMLNINEDWKSLFKIAITAAILAFGSDFKPAKAQDIPVPPKSEVVVVDGVQLHKFTISHNKVIIYKNINGEYKMIVAVPFMRNANLARTAATTTARMAFKMFRDSSPQLQKELSTFAPHLDGIEPSKDNTYIMAGFNIEQEF